MIHPLIVGAVREDPWKLLRAALAIALQTGVLLARIGIVANADAPLGHARTMIAHWLSGLLFFVFWAAFAFAGVDRYIDVTERSTEFGLLRIFGASDGYFLRLLAEETMVAVLPGALFGIFVAYLLGATFAYVSNGLVTILIPCFWLPVVACISGAASLVGAVLAIPGAVREGVAQAL